MKGPVRYVAIIIRPSEELEAISVLERATPAPRPPGWILTLGFVSLAMIGAGVTLALVAHAVVWFFSSAVPW